MKTQINPNNACEEVLRLLHPVPKCGFCWASVSPTRAPKTCSPVDKLAYLGDYATAGTVYGLRNVKHEYKVCVIGAAGGIGQPLSMILKCNPLVTTLAIHDVVPYSPGVALDLAHINTACAVEVYNGEPTLGSAIHDSSIVVIPAGIAHKTGMMRQDLFNTNARNLFKIMTGIAQFNPTALVAIITNPINSLIPLASELMARRYVYDPAKIFGVTTLDLVRASTFVGAVTNIDPASMYVPVIGGHAGSTIIPLLSQCTPKAEFDDKTRDKLIKLIQDAGTNVVKAKGGNGSATLSMAYAGARFVGALLKGLAGENNVVECAYVRSNVTEASYFSTPVLLGKYGMACNLGYGEVNAFEKDMIQKAIPILSAEIQVGIDYATKQIQLGMYKNL